MHSVMNFRASARLRECGCRRGPYSFAGAALVLLVLASPLALPAQQFSSSNATVTLPTVHQAMLDRAEWSLLAAAAASRTLDYSGTWRDQHASCHCLHEDNLPDLIANHKPMLAAFEAGAVATDFLLATTFQKRHHSLLAKLALGADVIVVLPTAINNYLLPITVRKRMPA